MTTQELLDQIERLGVDFAGSIEPLVDEQNIRAAQAQFLGKKGALSALMKDLGQAAAGRPAAGR
jgi:hypothetical protein